MCSLATQCSPEGDGPGTSQRESPQAPPPCWAEQTGWVGASSKPAGRVWVRSRHLVPPFPWQPAVRPLRLCRLAPGPTSPPGRLCVVGGLEAPSGNSMLEALGSPYACRRNTRGEACMGTLGTWFLLLGHTSPHCRTEVVGVQGRAGGQRDTVTHACHRCPQAYAHLPSGC